LYLGGGGGGGGGGGAAAATATASQATPRYVYYPCARDEDRE